MNFMSPVKKIDGLWIDKMPSGKPVKVKRAVQVGRIVLLEGENGCLYSNDAERVCYVPGCFDRFEYYFKGLKALGILTREQIEAHKAACTKRDVVRSKRHAANDLVRGARDSGIKLSAEQEAFVREFGDKDVG